MSKANERETLGGILAIGGGSYGVSASKVSLRMTLQDGHKVTTSFDGVVTDCSDDNIKEAMATRGECKFKATKENGSLSQTVSGVVAAARNGHEPSLEKIRELKGALKPASTPAETPEPAQV